MAHDQILEFRSTSLVQMTHSYCLLSISSWILVGRSSAEDLVVTLGAFGGFGGFGVSCCAVGSGLGAGTDWPGTNSGAAGRKSVPEARDSPS